MQIMQLIQSSGSRAAIFNQQSSNNEMYPSANCLVLWNRFLLDVKLDVKVVKFSWIPNLKQTVHAHILANF